jgi:uncharacterized repeat protein (TIGR03803 family)
LIDVRGLLYGTAVGGGAYSDGTVYTITTSGTEKVLHSFAGTTYDGIAPSASLIDVNGILYGTTVGGGAYGDGGDGTVYTITTSGTEKVLHSFAGGSDGANPYAALINVGGTLYGTTAYGGANNDGTVFRITQSGTETVLHSFGGSGDGDFPYAALLDVKGTLYGTTSEGGTHVYGTVFSITTDGYENVLYNFGSTSTDGRLPVASMVYLSATLYGTTEAGGSGNNGNGYGTIFSLTARPGGGLTLKALSPAYYASLSCKCRKAT